MRYQIYTAEFKLTMIQEYATSGYSVKAFARKNNIKYSTFRSWLYRFNKNEQQLPVKNTDTNLLRPIDVTDEAKDIVKRESVIHSEPIKLEYRGMKLTFPVSCLKEVIEAINNG